MGLIGMDFLSILAIRSSNILFGMVEFKPSSPDYLFSELYRIYPLVKLSMAKMGELAFLNNNR